LESTSEKRKRKVPWADVEAGDEKWNAWRLDLTKSQEE